MKSRADAISGEVDKAKGDQRAIWRMSNRLLHSKPSTYYNDDDLNRLVTQFSQFFSDKLTRISDTIASTLTSTSSVVARHVHVVHYHLLASLPWLPPTCNVSSSVYRPSLHRSTDIVPTSLLKSCSDVFAVMIARLANLSFRDGRFPTCFKLAEVIVLGTVNQFRSAPDIDTVQVDGASLSTSTTLKSLGVVLDQRLTFHDHANVVKSCNYHTRAIRHIRHLLTHSAA